MEEIKKEVEQQQSNLKKLFVKNDWPDSAFEELTCGKGDDEDE